MYPGFLKYILLHKFIAFIVTPFLVFSLYNSFFINCSCNETMNNTDIRIILAIFI